ncbi:MAG: hypothetical protein JW878_01380 [Methanomicrobia archaeon]|nr:hypothetical protein [Methanomicrobia archaeon]
MNVLEKGVVKEAGKREDMSSAAKTYRKNPGTSVSIPPAKFCLRERGGVCPGNCNLCVQRYIFGQIPF